MAKHPIGVLILHGFASSLDSINVLERPLQLLNLPTHIPVLRGHGAKTPIALSGVSWRDWVYDAETGMRGLMAGVDKVIIIGHGMGGLLALILAANSRDKVDSLVLAAPSISLPKPMLRRQRLQVLSPFIQKTFPRWMLPPSYADKKLSKTDTNYRWAPMDAIRNFLELVEVTRSRLLDVKVPVLILQSKRDDTISDEGPNLIRDGISTPPADIHIHWFKKCEHEMFRDCEAKQVTEAVVDYIMGRVG